MVKTVFRYFFDFMEGQERWLNRMAEKGYRLKSCGRALYTFEKSRPNEYEYAVEFVADKSFKNSKDYKSFLENMGYRTFYKNINLNFSVGKVKWRPWAKGMGQIATSPGGFNKELLIIEKPKNGEPFELHTDLKDLMSGYQTLLKAYIWSAAQALVLAVMFLLLDFCTWLAVFPAALVFLWSVPIIRYSRAIGKLKHQGRIYE